MAGVSLRKFDIHPLKTMTIWIMKKRVGNLITVPLKIRFDKVRWQNLFDNVRKDLSVIKWEK